MENNLVQINVIRCKSIIMQMTQVHNQRPWKHFESGGALTKRGTFVYDQNQTIL